MNKRAFPISLAIGVLLVAAGCSKTPTVEGRYNMTKGPVKNVVVDFGKNTFVFSTGASGSYEISKGQVIMTGVPFSGVFKIEGDKLIGQNGKFDFQRRSADDKSPIDMGPRGGDSVPGNDASGNAAKSKPMDWSIR